jgi:hypothetical protein
MNLGICSLTGKGTAVQIEVIIGEKGLSSGPLPGSLVECRELHKYNDANEKA